ncbi:MAG: gfo/Idh/MocA family oxidoreductase, partial [Armatimonadetes bacterium]
MAEPLRVGIVGCGNISDIYLRNLAKFEETAVVAVTDLDAGKAQAAARDYGVEVEPDVASILARSDVDLVLNLTVPAAHFEVSLRALESG